MIFTISVLGLFTSCLSRKEFNYFQDKKSQIATSDSMLVKNKYEHKIQPSDILSIYVTSMSPEASSFFNAPVDKDGSIDREALPLITGYLVDASGNISLPLIGNVPIGGLTLIQAKDKIQQLLEKYLINPSVKLYIDNFKVTLLGELLKPGIYTIPTEKITISEALALAGDITVYGIRTDILVVRENDNGEREFGHLDITSREVFKSKFYYLRPDDIIYVNARKTKITTGDFFFKVAPLAISIVTLISILVVRF